MSKNNNNNNNNNNSDIEASTPIDMKVEQAGPKPSNDSNKIIDAGAALVAGFSFIIGFILYASQLSDLVATGDKELTRVEAVIFLKDNQTIYYVSNIILYIIFGLAQLTLTTSITNRIKNDNVSPSIVPIVHALGVIWSGLVIAAGMIANVGASVAINLYNEDKTDPATAGLLWKTVHTIFVGVGGGNEIVGALWVLGVSWLWRCQKTCLYRTANILGFIAGVAGIVSMVPSLEDAGAVFGVGMIIWYILVGIIFLRQTL